MFTPLMPIEALELWLTGHGLTAALAAPVARLCGITALIVLAWLANFIAKQVILRVVSSLIRRTAFRWDDAFLQAGVFTRLSHIAPAIVAGLLGPTLFPAEPHWSAGLRTAVNVYLVVIALLVIDALLNAIIVIYHERSSTRSVPVKGFAQGAKLIAFLVGGILILSLLLGRSPLYFFSGLGALTAVLLLVFRDSILGFVAGIQISVNQMVRIGDWIEMQKFGADGDVIDVSLTTVKVQNWDKTITTIPAYALISEPVKNWRGMQESGGRRIKRAIHLDMQSFRFLDDALMARMMTFRRLRPYLEQKLPELKEWNEREGEDLSVPVNGRRLTNIGCFRAYVVAYLRSHPKIHPDLTFLVRQLAPTDKGLPLEIYVFVNDVKWANYEGVQSDIFDHLLTVVPEFGLRVFQSPSGHDVREALGARAP